MIVCTNDCLVLGRIEMTSIVDYDGIRHDGIPVMALRHSTREEWELQIQSRGKWNPLFETVHFNFYYEVSID